jgi:hypothetical protein
MHGPVAAGRELSGAGRSAALPAGPGGVPVGRVGGAREEPTPAAGGAYPSRRATARQEGAPAPHPHPQAHPRAPAPLGRSSHGRSGCRNR